MSWDFQVRHYDERGAPGARPEVPAPARRCALSARGDAGRLHRAQRDDLHAAARLRLGPHRHAHRRPVVARGANAPPRAPGRGLPPPPLWRALRRLGIDPTGHGWDGWLRTEKSIPLPPSATTSWCRWCVARRALSSTAWRRRSRARCAGCAAAAIRTRGRGAAAASRACATRRCPRAAIAAPERASACSRSPRRTAIGCTSSSTRWRPRVVLDASGAARGVEYRKGRHLYRATRRARDGAGRRARSARAARGDPVRRRLQHAAAADALGHRPGRAAARRTASPSGSICRVSARNLQDRYEVAVTHRMRRPWRVLDGATLRPRRSALAALEREPRRHVRLERRGARADRPLGARAPRARPLLHGAAGALRGLSSRVFRS